MDAVPYGGIDIHARVVPASFPTHVDHVVVDGTARRTVTAWRDIERDLEPATVA